MKKQKLGDITRKVKDALLNPSEILVIETLSNRAMTAAELSAILKRAPGSISTTCVSLKSKGYLTSERNGTDYRTNVYKVDHEKVAALTERLQNAVE